MEGIRVLGVSLNQTPMDWSGNESRIMAALAQAVVYEASMVIFPELSLSGYGCQDAFLSQDWMAPVEDCLARILPKTDGKLVIMGAPIWHHGACYNCALVCVDGQLVACVPKQRLANDGIHEEARWFAAGVPGEISSIQLAKQWCLFGDVLVQWGTWRVGVEICRDAWTIPPVRENLIDRGANFIANLSASHFTLHKLEQRRAIVQSALAQKVAYVMCNALGNESGLCVYDGDIHMAHDGQYRCSDRLVLGAMQVLHDVFSVPPMPELPADLSCQVVDWSVPPTARAFANDCLNVPAAWECAESLGQAAFTQAATLGLWDYCRKSKAKGFVLNLSGGIDSSVCALLVAILADRLFNQYSWPVIADQLGWPEHPVHDRHSFLKQFLICVYQKTAHNGPESEAAAKALVAGIGATGLQWDIDEWVQSVQQTVETQQARQLSWDNPTDELSLQNIQARMRVPGLWLLANMNDAIVLSTGNRSEITTGYYTLDGDSAGGFNPIAGMSKVFLKQWLEWVVHEGPMGLTAYPCAALVLDNPPSAELKPTLQQDEKELMPYDLLQAIEQQVLGQYAGPTTCFERLKAMHIWPDKLLVHAIEQFFHRWMVNQFKRIRLPASLHLDIYGVSQQATRWPLLSGKAFQAEIAQLKAGLAQSRVQQDP